MKHKIKEKLVYIGTSIYLATILFISNMNVAFADVAFQKDVAKNDIKNLTGPISDVLIWVAAPATAIAIGFSYLSWNGGEPEEKEQNPFFKVAKKQIIAFAIFGLSGAALKWFTIS